MRTTVRLNENLLRDVKKIATESGRTLTSIMEDALRDAVSRQKKGPCVKPIKLETFKGKGVRPGIDLDDSSSLYDLMDGLA